MQSSAVQVLPLTPTLSMDKLGLSTRAETVTALITFLILVDARMPGQEASPKNPSLKLSEPVLLEACELFKAPMPRFPPTSFKALGWSSL